MKPIIPQSEVQSAHAEYCRLVGPLPLTMDRIYWWGQWFAGGRTRQDLRLVLLYLQAEIKKGNRHQGSIRWSRLIQQAENFDEEAIFARGALRRKPPVTARQRALNTLRPTAAGGVVPEETRVTARHVGDYIEKLRAAAGGAA